MKRACVACVCLDGHAQTRYGRKITPARCVCMSYVIYYIHYRSALREEALLLPNPREIVSRNRKVGTFPQERQRARKLTRRG